MRSLRVRVCKTRSICSSVKSQGLANRTPGRRWRRKIFGAAPDTARRSTEPKNRCQCLRSQNALRRAGRTLLRTLEPSTLGSSTQARTRSILLCCVCLGRLPAPPEQNSSGRGGRSKPAAESAKHRPQLASSFVSPQIRTCRLAEIRVRETKPTVQPRESLQITTYPDLPDRNGQDEI